MKSLILKDLYNIGHNVKSMLFLLIVFVALIPSSGIVGYIFACTFLCGTIVVTTFSFDDHSKWTRYAMITPISRKDLVVGKFIVLAIFCVIGSLIGLAIGGIGELILKQDAFGSEGIGELLFSAFAAFLLALSFGSVSIPLIFKFGAENGRLLLLASFLIPAAVCFGIYQLFVLLGLTVTRNLILALLCCSPLIVFLWCYGMYRISYRIFAKQELSA